jgi:hypothetical protein
MPRAPDKILSVDLPPAGRRSARELEDCWPVRHGNRARAAAIESSRSRREPQHKSSRSGLRSATARAVTCRHDHVARGGVTDRFQRERRRRRGGQAAGKIEHRSPLAPGCRLFIGVSGPQYRRFIEGAAGDLQRERQTRRGEAHAASAGPPVTLNGVVSEACCQNRINARHVSADCREQQDMVKPYPTYHRAQPILGGGRASAGSSLRRWRGARGYT